MISPYSKSTLSIWVHRLSSSPYCLFIWLWVIKDADIKRIDTHFLVVFIVRFANKQLRNCFTILIRRSSSVTNAPSSKTTCENQRLAFKTIHLQDQACQTLLDFGTTYPARTATFYRIVDNVPENFTQTKQIQIICVSLITNVEPKADTVVEGPPHAIGQWTTYPNNIASRQPKS